MGRPPENWMHDMWGTAALVYEYEADQHDSTGGPVPRDYWFATRHGLNTYGELVLYCYLEREREDDFHGIVR